MMPVTLFRAEMSAIILALEQVGFNYVPYITFSGRKEQIGQGSSSY